MFTRGFVVAVIILLLPIAVYSADDCPPLDYTAAQLQQLKQNGFEIDDPEQRNSLAVALLGCVAEPDPALRDGIAFEGLSTWLRAKKLSPETVNVLRINLLEQIKSEDDPSGFQQPFAALILSEVARTDRVESWLSEQQFEELVEIAAAYLGSVTDYRGFSETQGWRHGVAHGSDLVLQLILNPQINAVQTSRLMDAVAKQISPGNEVFYTYGEPGRLARAVIYAFIQTELEPSSWQSWFDKLASPTPFDNWGETFTSQAGLAKRHNTLAFLQAMYVNTSSSDDARTRELEQIVLGALESVLGG